MDIKIRLERESDYRHCENLAREAFWNLYFPGCDEHYVVHKMRDCADYVKELSFVAEIDGVVQGAIYFTRSRVVGTEGRGVETVSFGPVFVSPHLHRSGVGRALISHAIEKAKEMGIAGMLILGYPYHYETYGFRGSKKYNISNTDGKYYKGLMALPLYEGAFDGVKGYAEFSSVFEVSREDVEAFDATFAPKVKAVQDSQKEYETAASALDE